MNKILVNTKELLGVPADTDVFDSQLVMYINMCLTTLDQIGLGPNEGYQTTTSDGDLEDFLPDNEEIYGQVQVYIANKVKIVFDPPTSAAVLAALQSSVAEAEWRLKDYPKKVT